MSCETYRVIHRLYKRLNWMKTLVQIRSSTLSISVNIFEVFSSQLEELQIKVEIEYSKADISQPNKMRLAAIQLALHFDYLESLVHSMSHLTKSTAFLSDEMQKIENYIQTFDEIASNNVIFLSYFKMLNLVARINSDYLKNFSVSKHWLNKAEQIYLNVLASQGEQTFYDNHELFSKSPMLKPTNNAFDIIDQLFSENTRILERILQNENSEINCLLQWLHTHQNSSTWLDKLLSIVPQLLNQNEFKIVAYFLRIAQKVATEKDAYDWQVQSSIATSWMHYVFGVFDCSKKDLLSQFPSNDVWLLKRSKLKGQQIHALGDCAVTIPRSIFNCFSSSIPLTQDELKYCTNSLESIDEAKNLLEFSIDLVNLLICDGDFRCNPMNFIVHTYQMADLLSISMILTNQPDECFGFQQKKFKYLARMVKWTQEHCSNVFEILGTTFFTDLNETLIDMYSTNFKRIFIHSKCNDGNLNKIQELIEKKLNDLHDLNTLVADGMMNKIE